LADRTSVRLNKFSDDAGQFASVDVGSALEVGGEPIRDIVRPSFACVEGDHPAGSRSGRIRRWWLDPTIDAERHGRARGRGATQREAETQGDQLTVDRDESALAWMAQALPVVHRSDINPVALVAVRRAMRNLPLA